MPPLVLDTLVVFDRTDEQTELEDEKHLGIVLEDESELVASTTSLQTYPSPPVSELEVVSCSDHRASKFFKEIRLESQEIKDKVKDSASVRSLSTDSSSDDMEEDELPSCPEPDRRNNFLKDIEMMREEFLVKPTLPKSAKDDIQKRLKQAVVGKIPPIQLTQVKKDIKRGLAKEKLAKKYALSPFSTPTPRDTSVGSTDVSTLPPLSYKNVNVLDNPFGFLKRWDKTPNFYEFCLYLVGTEGKAKRTKTDIRGGVKHGAAGHKLPMQSSDATGTSESKSAHKKSRKNLKEKKKTLHDAHPGDGSTSLESSDDNRKTVKQKGMQEALVELHAHTRIQIAAEERRWKSGNLPKTKAVTKKGADVVQSVETMLKQAALGITVSGTHLLSDEQEQLLEDEEYILSTIDPWHVSVAFAYLAGGVCDSVGVRDYLLRRRKQILNIIENSKQTVKVNEARVRCALKNAHDKTLGKTPKAMEEAIFEELNEQGKSRLGKEKDKKSKKGREHTEENFEERKTHHGKVEIIADLENEDDGKLHQESDQDVRLKKSPSDKGKHETTTESDTTKSGKKDKKRSGKKGRKRKPAGYVYIEDSKIPDKISPNRLFRIMRLNEIFDPQKLHSAYSFEKLYSHRKNDIPHYGNLLSMFEKPFKQTKKKKKPETHAKHKTKGAKIAEEIMEKTPVKEISPPFVLGKLRDFKFLQYRNHQPEPMKTEVKTPKEMSADEICRNMILAMQMFVVRKERATTVYGTCQYMSKVSVTFTKKSEEEAWMGVPPQVDCQWLVTAVCKTLSKTL